MQTATSTHLHLLRITTLRTDGYFKANDTHIREAENVIIGFTKNRISQNAIGEIYPSGVVPLSNVELGEDYYLNSSGNLTTNLGRQRVGIGVTGGVYINTLYSG